MKQTAMMDRSMRGLNTNVSFASLGADADPLPTLQTKHKYYSSTPHVSPGTNSTALNHSSIKQAQRSHLVLPVGLLAPEEQFPKPKLMNHSNVTMRRERHNNLTSVSISPIIGNDSMRNIIQLTEPRTAFGQFGARQLFPDDSILDSTENRGLFAPPEAPKDALVVRQSPFPYPDVSEFDEFEEHGEILCNHLKLFAAFKKLESEKNRLLGLGIKKREKAEEKMVPYEFTPETFSTANTEASANALYLIFSSYNPKEIEQRFRDCWPIYEKKMEAAFRQAALKWLKEIIQANPSFFKDAIMDRLGGLLVSAGGDRRYLSMMNQLCRFVLYTLASQKKGLLKQQVLLPPTATDDSEITNRQIHFLKAKTMQLVESTMDNYHMLILSDRVVKDRLRQVDELANFVSQTEEMYSARERNLISMHPDIFGNPSEDELSQRDLEVSSLSIMQILDNESYNDFVRDRLEETLQKQTEDIYRSVSFLQDIMEDYSKVWYILEMDKSDPAVLNCDEMLPCQLQTSTGEPSLNTFVDSLMNVTKNLVSNQYLNSDVPLEILAEYEALSLRVNFLDMLMDKVNEVSASRISRAVRHAKPKREVQKLRLADYDWSKLSKIRECGPSKLWDMTPIRVYDINKHSGRTPGVNNFLDLSLSYPPCEQQSIVKRRGASIIKQRRLHHQPNHTLDGSTPLRNVAMHRKSEDITDSRKSVHANFDLSSNMLSSHNNDSIVNQQQQLSETPALSISMRKSVSFGNTSLDISRHSNRFSMSSIHSLTPTQNSPRVCLSPIENNGDISTSESDIPVGLDTSTQERVDRLLESIITSNNRRSQSSFGNTDAEPNASIIEDGSKITVEEINLSLSNRKSTGISLNENDAGASESFGNLSLIEGWEEMGKDGGVTKGIMDVSSHAELFRNSDSDD